MTQDYQAGEQAERARTATWLAQSMQFYSELAAKQRAIAEPTATVNEAYARAFRSALSHVMAGEQVAQPTVGKVAA